MKNDRSAETELAQAEATLLECDSLIKRTLALIAGPEPDRDELSRVLEETRRHITGVEETLVRMSCEAAENITLAAELQHLLDTENGD